MRCVQCQCPQCLPARSQQEFKALVEKVAVCWKVLVNKNCFHPESSSFLTYITALSGVPLLTDAVLSFLCDLTLAVQTMQSLTGTWRLPLPVTQCTAVTLLALAAVRLRVQCHARTSHTPARKQREGSEGDEKKRFNNRNPTWKKTHRCLINPFIASE